MKDTFSKIEELAGNVKDYVNTRIRSAKLQAAEKTSLIVGNVFAILVVAIVFIFFIVFAGIGLSLLLGKWIGLLWAGFLIVSFLFLLAAFWIWKKRETLFGLPIMNAFIKQLFENDDEEN